MNLWIAIAAVVAIVVCLRPLGIISSTGLLTPGLRSEFFARYNQQRADAVYAQVSTPISSDKDAETYRALGTPPQMREFIDGRQERGMVTESYSVTNAEYEATIGVSRKEDEDDQTGQIRIRVGELADRAADHPDYLLGQVLVAAESAVCSDGQYFFDTDHVLGASGSQSNDLTYDAASASVPTTAEFKASFQQAVAAMMAFKDDQGLPLNIKPSGLVVLVPPANYFTALEALQVAIIANTGNVIAGMAKVIPFPFLTDATKWYLIKTDVSARPFVFQDRMPIEFTGIDQPTSETVFNKSKYLFGVRARYALAFFRWYYAVLTTFT